MFYGGKYMVLWKERKDDGQDALMRSFDTTIESKSYIQGFVDAIMMRTQQILSYGDSYGYLIPEHFDQIFTADLRI